MSMQADRTEREQAIEALAERLAHIRARLDKAQQRKQVELHIELADVGLLLERAEAACKAYRRVAP